MAKILVTIPTYNEKESIGAIIKKLAEQVFPQLDHHQMEILVVDDTSPDKTYGVVQSLQDKYSNLHLLLNKGKQGLGAAYIKAFYYAMDKLDPDYIVEMDADLQHRPIDLIKMIREGVDQGYDYVVGTRFIPGGSTTGLNTLKRKFLSRAGSLFLRVSLGMFKYHDLTTGFKITKVKRVLDQIDLKDVCSKSYAYKIHLYYLIHKMGAKIKEVPIAFDLREKGWSKMDSEDIFESLKVVFKIRLPFLAKLL